MVLDALMFSPSWVCTPVTLLFSTRSALTMSCQRWMFSLASSVDLQCWAKVWRSFCVLGDHMAGPLDRFSIRN